MSGFVDVTGVRVLGGYTLELTWADGAVTTVDVGPYLYGSVLEPLKDPAVFATVTVDPEAGTVVWPNGADISPEELRRVGRPQPLQEETGRRLRAAPGAEELRSEQLRSLLLHYAVAGKVAADPAGLRALAWGNLARLRDRHPRAAVWVEDWARLLDGPLLNLLEALTSRSEQAQDLRQTSPFAGALTAAEREAVLAAARAERAAATAPPAEHRAPDLEDER